MSKASLDGRHDRCEFQDNSGPIEFDGALLKVIRQYAGNHRVSGSPPLSLLDHKAQASCGIHDSGLILLHEALAIEQFCEKSCGQQGNLRGQCRK